MARKGHAQDLSPYDQPGHHVALIMPPTPKPNDPSLDISAIDESTKSSLRSVLRGFNGATAGIEASAVISSDGLIIASVLEKKADPDRFAAMCASLLALAGRAAKEIQRGQLRLVLVDGEEGAVLLIHAGPDMVLAVAVQKGANLGLIFHESRKIAVKLLSVVAGNS